MENEFTQKVDGNDNFVAGRDINVRIEKFLQKRPGAIGRFLSKLVEEINYEQKDLINDYKLSEINEKISYNNVVIYKDLIDEYGLYGSQVEKVCEALEIDRPGTKTKLFLYINSIYKKTRARLLQENSDPKKIDSDLVIEEINNQLIDLVKKNIKDTENIDEEDLHLSILILIAKAFTDCKILEKPEI